MTLAEYYDRLAAHDWHYMRSDDHRVFGQGEREALILHSAANTSPRYRELYEAWKRWAHYNAPLPRRPK